MSSLRNFVVLLLVVFVSGCGGDDPASSGGGTLTKYGWPVPDAPVTAVYRVTVDVTTEVPEEAFGEPSSIRAHLVFDHSETFTPAADGDGKLALVRSHATGDIEMTAGDKSEQGNVRETLNMLRDDSTSALALWFPYPGNPTEVEWSAATGAPDALVFGRVPTSAEAPAAGLAWKHDTWFLPELGATGPSEARSTIRALDDERLEIDSTLVEQPGAATTGSRALVISRVDGQVISGTFEGQVTWAAKNQQGDVAKDVVFHVTGKIERIEPLEIPPEVVRVDRALVQLTDVDPATRAAAAGALAGVFPDAGRAAPVLVAALSDESAEVRKAAEETLESLGAQAAEPLAVFLEDQSAPGWFDYMRVVSMVKQLGAKITPNDFAGAAGAAPRAGALSATLFVSMLGPSEPWQSGDDLNDLLMDLSTPRVRSGIALRDLETARFCAACLALHSLERFEPSASRAANHLLLAIVKQERDAPLLERMQVELRWSALRILDVQGSLDPATVEAAEAAINKYGGDSTSHRERLFRNHFQRILGPVQKSVDVSAHVKELLSQIDLTSISQRVVHRDRALRSVVDELGALGSAAADAVPKLEKLLEGSHVEGKRPLPFTVACAAALCRIDEPTGKRVGYLTVSLQPPKSKNEQAWETFNDSLPIAARALADVTDRFPSKAMRRQAADRAFGALDHARYRALEALLHVIKTAGADARDLAPKLAEELERAETRWQELLTTEPPPRARGMSLPGDRSTLMVMLGAKFTDALTLRLGLVRALAGIGANGEDKAKVIELLTPFAESDEPVMAYEASRAIRAIGSD